MKRLMVAVSIVLLLVNMFSDPVFAQRRGGGGRGWGGRGGRQGWSGYRGGRGWGGRGWGWGTGGFVAGALLGAAAASAASQPQYVVTYVNGAPYYMYNGVYYQMDAAGRYYMVPAPVVYAQPTVIQLPAAIEKQPAALQQMPMQQATLAPAPVQAPASEQAPSPAQTAVTAPAEKPEAQAQGTFTVNIPNSKGGYTSVTLKKMGKGYVGPQGEFYTEFPKVEHLKEMYGK
jgi:hypothetical protein